MGRLSSISESSATFPAVGAEYTFFDTAPHLIRVDEQTHLALAANDYGDTIDYSQINAWVIDTSSGAPVISEQVTVVNGTPDNYVNLASFTSDWNGHAVVILQDNDLATMALVGVSGGLPVVLDSVDITSMANPDGPSNVQTFELPNHPGHVTLMHNIAPSFDTVFRPVSTVGDVLAVGDVLLTELNADAADHGGRTQTGHAEADDRLSLYNAGALTYEVTPTSMTKIQQDDDGQDISGHPSNFIFPSQSRGFYLSNTQVIWFYDVHGPTIVSGTGRAFYSIGNLDTGWTYDPAQIYMEKGFDTTDGGDAWDGGGFGPDDLTGPVMMLADGTPVVAYVHYTNAGADSVRLKALDTSSPDWSYQDLETYISTGPTPMGFLLDAVPVGPRLAPTAILAAFITGPHNSEFTATLFNLVPSATGWVVGSYAWTGT